MAFPVEPFGRRAAADGAVMFSYGDISDDPWVAHWNFDRCAITGGQPHKMSECGMFDVPRGAKWTKDSEPQRTERTERTEDKIAT